MADESQIRLKPGVTRGDNSAVRPSSNQTCPFVRAQGTHATPTGHSFDRTPNTIVVLHPAFWIVGLRSRSVVILAGQSRPPARAGEPEPVHFSRDVLPILSENCFTCHGPDAKARKADLRLDVKETALRKTEPVIVPGKSGESELIQRVTSKDADERDAAAEIGQEADRAPDRALEEVDRPGGALEQALGLRARQAARAPPVRDAAWVRNPIDRFVLARLETEGLAPSPPAERTTLIRRLTLDLTGLPPTPAEVDAFLADAAPSAYEALVDRLLASPHYGERMAMDWLDGARYADTNGFQNDFARTMWPWRDWVIAAFNRNQPFDRFLIEQIAGDLLPGRQPGPEDRHRLQPQQPDRHRGRLDRRGISRRERRRPGRDHGDGLPRPDPGLRPLPRPQVRPDLADRVLPVLRLLQQRQRAGGLHRDARQRAPLDHAADPEGPEAPGRARNRDRRGQGERRQDVDRERSTRSKSRI